VGLRKGQGDVAGAVELLQQYLATQATDWYAWEEAADLYLQIQVRCWLRCVGGVGWGGVPEKG
jgi:hypothetical protein